MKSKDSNKTLKIVISIIIRLTYLAWPGLSGIILTSMELHPFYSDWWVLEQYEGVLIFGIVLFTFVFTGMVIDLIVLPCCGNTIIPVVILFIDISLFIGNTIYIWDSITDTYRANSRDGRLYYQTGSDLAISGTIFGFAILIVFVIGTIIPLYRVHGFVGLLERKKFYYGGLFIDPISKQTDIDFDLELFKYDCDNETFHQTDNTIITKGRYSREAVP